MMRSVFLTLPERAFLPAGPEVALALRGEQEVEPQLFICSHCGNVHKGGAVDSRYALTVKFVVHADSAEEAEELVEAACEKAAATFSEISYEGIEDIEEDEE